MKIEIVGQDAEAATQELLSITGIEGSYETLDEPQRAEVLTTIATIEHFSIILVLVGAGSPIFTPLKN